MVPDFQNDSEQISSSGCHEVEVISRNGVGDDEMIVRLRWGLTSLTSRKSRIPDIKMGKKWDIENGMDMTGWLDYFSTGLETQMIEVKERTEQVIRRDVLIQNTA